MRAEGGQGTLGPVPGLLLAWLVVSCSGPPAEPQPAARPAEPAATSPCEAYCRRSLGCAGAPSESLASECRAQCGAGGRYASLEPSALACAERTECGAFEACMTAALEASLDRRIAEATPVDEPLVPDEAPELPPGWPDGFPLVPGGTPVAAPATGAARIAVLSYGTSSEAVESLLRLELERQGWALDEPVAVEGARRFTARQEAREVAVSIYEDGGRARIQTMELVL